MSNLKDISFQLDMQYQKIQDIGTLVQYDVNANIFRIRLTKENKVYDITGASNVIINIKDDELLMTSKQCDIVDAANGIISVVVPENCIGYRRTFTGEVQVSFGTARLTSSLFQYEVREELATDADTSLDPDYPILTQLIADVSTLESNVEAAEAARETAENTRESNETTRQSNESTRQTQETTRVNQESSRVTAENNRVTAENNRESDETTRENQEVTRQSNETDRISNENTRQSSEDIREQFIFDGNYNASVPYVKNNTVLYEGSSYVALQDTLGNVPTNATYWQPVAIGGESIGDMSKVVYDPTNVDSDVFDMDNMVEGTDSKILTAQERLDIAANNDKISYPATDSAKVGNISVSQPVDLDTMESDLSDLKSPSYSTIANTKLAITPFTTGTLDAPIKYQMEGVSVANSVVNNDFSDGTTLWYSDNSSLTVTNNILKNIADGTAPYGRVHQYISGLRPKTGDKVFLYSKTKVDNGLCEDISFLFRNNSSLPLQNIVVDSPTIDTWTEISGTITASGDYDLGARIYIKHEYADATTANGKVMEVDGNAGVYAINMTQYGITDFTEAQMLDLVNAMEAGTDIQSAIVDIRTTGKNLFDKDKGVIDGSYFSSTGALTSLEGASYSEQYIKVEKGSTYISNISLVLGTYNYNKEWILRLVVSANTPFVLNCDYIRVSQNTSLNLSLLQLEQGTTATAYEPYKQNLLAPQIELKSLPNGVADELSNAVVDPADSNKLLRLDKTRHVQNVSDEYTLVSGDITQLNTASTNVDLVILNNSAISDINNFGEDNRVAKNILTTITSPLDSATIDQTSSAWKHYINIGNWAIIVPKGTYADLASAQADLAGTVIQYQLAEPVVTELDIDEMYSFENGVLYQNGIPVSIDYTTATNQGAVLSEVAKTVEKIDDSYASKVQEDWIEPTLLNGWVSFSPTVQGAFYMKDNMGFVHFKGLIKSGTTTAGTVIFTLPSGYRPQQTSYFATTDNNSFAVISVTSGGSVRIDFGGNTSLALDGISFRAEG